MFPTSKDFKNKGRTLDSKLQFKIYPFICFTGRSSTGKPSTLQYIPIALGPKTRILHLVAALTPFTLQCPLQRSASTLPGHPAHPLLHDETRFSPVSESLNMLSPLPKDLSSPLFLANSYSPNRYQLNYHP